MSARQGLRERLRAGFLVAPSIYDGLTALIAERAGFQACHVSGDGSAAQRGFADVGFISFGEVLDDVRYVAEAVSIPTIAPAPRGFNDEPSMARIVREYEAAGTAGLLVDDQICTTPGLVDGDQVLSVAAAVAKLSAALHARTDPDMVIIAGTSALPPNGWDDTLERVNGYREAGADMVLVDEIRGLGDLERYAAEVPSGGPTVYKGSLAPTSRVRELGFSLVISGGGLALSYVAVRDALVRVRAGGASEPVRNELRFDDITSLLGLEDVYALEAKYSADRTKER
jgi:2-methylisocitrate lyase-like PEP mutase family enzyme